jgi:hypothetical protein
VGNAQEDHARTVGRVLRDTGSSDIVDGSVVVIAQRRAEEVLTLGRSLPLSGAHVYPFIL